MKKKNVMMTILVIILVIGIYVYEYYFGVQWYLVGISPYGKESINGTCNSFIDQRWEVIDKLKAENWTLKLVRC